MPLGLTREDDARFENLKKETEALIGRINARRKTRGQQPLAITKELKDKAERARNSAREFNARGEREERRGGRDVVTRNADDSATREVARLTREIRDQNAARIRGSATDDMVEALARKRRNDVGGFGAMEDKAFHRAFLARTGTREYANYKRSFEAFMRHGIHNAEAQELPRHLASYRAMAAKMGRFQGALHTESNQSGGFLVPEEIDLTIERALYDLSIMRQLATVRPMTSATLKKYFNLGGANTGWVGERETRGETNTPVIKELEYPAAEVYAQPEITQIALEDVGVDLEAWLAEELQTAFSEAESDAWINGDGNKKPWGLIGGYGKVANATFVADLASHFGKWGYVATGAAATFPTANPGDVLIDLFHALRAQMRQGSSWLMNDLTAATISKFKDGEGNYLWRKAISDDHDATLLGKAVGIDELMPDIGAGNYPIAFGNFARGYLILDRAGMSSIRDDVTKKGWVKFYTRKRVMGGGSNFEAIKLLKVATS